MVAKIGLERDPPIGCNPTDRALTGRINSEDQLRVGRQGAVAASLEIQQVVEEAIGAEADNLLRVGLVDEGLGGRHWRQGGADERETPGGYRVPDVLDCRIIVGGYTPQQIVSLDVDRVGVTNIGVVPAEAARNAVVGPLDERAEIVREPPAGEEAHLLQCAVIVCAKMRRSTALLSGLRMGKSRCLEHDREWRP